MAQKTYGIDFGTGTIKIYKKGNGIVVLERNVVSTVGKENKPILRSFPAVKRNQRKYF